MKLRIGDYSACVLVEGVEQECYGIETSDDGLTVECWIVSEVGKTFTVSYTYAKDTIACADLYIDGEYAIGYPCNYPRRKSSSIDCRGTLSNTRTTSNTVRSFQFSNIELTDDDQYLEAGTKQSNMLKMWFRKASFNPGFSRDQPTSFANKVSSGNPRVHERTKKGLLAHTVGLGKETVSRQSETSHRVRFNGDIATFIFRYTSRDILRARGIIPTLPSNEHPEKIKDVKLEGHDLGPQSDSSTTKVKRELEDVLDLTAEDPLPARIKRPKTEAHEREVVDLTLD